jgi:uncharacterized surface protein with fasciclin (FAS1) repeats
MLALSVLVSILNAASYAETSKKSLHTENQTTAEEKMTESKSLDTQSLDVADLIQQEGQFKTLTQALEAAGLTDTLKNLKEVTLFAPTDEAFAKLPPGTLEDLLKPENKDKLISLLQYHVVEGAVKSKDVVKLREATTLDDGKQLKISSKNGVKINNAKVVTPDIIAKNGVIHGIDKVLMPE